MITHVESEAALEDDGNLKSAQDSLILYLIVYLKKAVEKDRIFVRYDTNGGRHKT